jgi:hypothetical protein
MKKLLTIIFILFCITAAGFADTIVFKDGSRIDVTKAWEENGQIKCKIAGVVIGYPKKDVKRIIRQKQSSYARQLSASEIATLSRKQPGSCYDLGRRFGHCTTLILYGEECPPQDDIPLPSRCKGRSDTENGMLEGIELANKSLNLPAAEAPAASDENLSVCFELGRRYGKCAGLSMYAQTCDPGDDVTIPLDCRGKTETKNGVRTGVRAAYEDMGFPTE